MTDPAALIERLRQRAKIAREEGTATALADALHFEEAAEALSSLTASPLPEEIAELLALREG